MNEIERAIKFLGYVKGYDIQSANLAIAALREQAERNKGCVWCKSDNKVTHNGEHFCFFCSYCGKRLKVEP